MEESAGSQTAISPSETQLNVTMAKVKATAKASAPARAPAARGRQVGAKPASKAKKTTGAVGKVRASSSSTTTKTTYERVRVETTTTRRTASSSIGSGGGKSRSRMSADVKSKIQAAVSARVKQAMREAKSAKLSSIQATVYLTSADVGFLPPSMRLGYEGSSAANLLGNSPIRFGRTTQCKVSSLDMKYVKSSGSLVITIKTSPL
jgi:hypothetical protein